MKKFRFICLAVVLALTFSVNGYATDNETDSELLKVDWYADYQDPNNVKLTIEIESEAGYLQNVSVAMYDDAFDALSTDNKPTFNDYYRMDEVVLKKGEVAKVNFSITNTGTPLADGAYRILVQGSGKDASLSTQQFPVWVINPSGIESIIHSFNGADASSVSGYLNNVKNALRLDVDGTESSKRLNAFINIRKEDFSNNFETLGDISDAWKVSEVIECLGKTPSDKTMLKNLTESNSEILGVDKSSKDYKKYTTDVYENMLHNNGLVPADTIDKVKTLFGESVALASVNGSSSSEISTCLSNYYKVLGIKEEIYQKYANCKDEQTKLKIQRLLLEKGFKTPAIVKETFETAVGNYIKEVIIIPSGPSNTPNVDRPSALDTPVTSTVTEDIVKPSASFNDCPNTHWAFEYVEELKNENIISGYSDGNFYPGKTVKREELVKMIVALSDIGDESDICSFGDVSADAWYYSYIASAYTAGLINGISETDFGVGSDISRQDVAVIVCRLLSKRGVSLNESNTDKTFRDSNEISDYATDSVDALVSLFVLNGFDDGTFRPAASLTRAEAAKIISLVKELIEQ